MRGKRNVFKARIPWQLRSSRVNHVALVREENGKSGGNKLREGRERGRDADDDRDDGSNRSQIVVAAGGGRGLERGGES